MTWHPLTLAIGMLLLLSWVLYLPIAWRALSILPHWRPVAGDAAQLRRERQMEWITHQGRWVLMLQAAGAVLLVIGISSVWPAHVPGAMCGTGVLQAMGPAGTQTLFYHAVAVGVLYVWRVIQGLDATNPYGLLNAWHARFLLLAAPIMTMESAAWIRAVGSVHGSPPVSCCAAVYIRAGSYKIQTVFSAVNHAHLLAACLAGAVALVVCGGWQWRRRNAIDKGVWAIPVITLVWLLVTMKALKTGVAPYVYQVLNHPCPWCLFLPEHGRVGYLYFGLLVWIAAESLALGVAAWTTTRAPGLMTAAGRRVRRAGCRIMLGASVFCLAVLWPVLLWRLRTGVWLV